VHGCRPDPLCQRHEEARLEAQERVHVGARIGSRWVSAYEISVGGRRECGCKVGNDYNQCLNDSVAGSEMELAGKGMRIAWVADTLATE
jgi:hypothetical protein